MIEAILCASTGGLITFFWLFLHLDTVSATAAESQKPAGGSTLTHTCVTAPPLKTFSPFFACFCSSLRVIHPGAAPGGSNGQNPARKKDLNMETVAL